MVKKIFTKDSISLFYLILVGELVFALPFHISRFFRPALLEDFNYSNTMLGVAFSVYGFTALISYIPGGYIADKISPRYLLFGSLLLTSLGGLFLLLKPSFQGLCIIYGYWGITTILFFWAALIKATRNIAGEKQGVSFGALEAGRGLIASLSGSVAVYLYTSTLIGSLYERLFHMTISKLSIVICFYSTITFLSSLLILIYFKDNNKHKSTRRKYSTLNVLNYLKPTILISLVVFAAYSGYKGIDYYVYYFYEVLGYSKEKSSLLITNLSYLRPVSAILAGIIADRISSRFSCLLLFLLMVISYICMSFINDINNIVYFLYFSFITSMVSIFALRGIFYSLLPEVNLPFSITGISVGIVSFIGYMPDIFIGPIFGYYLDKFEGLLAFQYCFIFLLCISITGLTSSIFLRRYNVKSL